MLQRELREVERRCQGAEARHEELASNIPEATRPLLRQLEAMQVTIAALVCCLPGGVWGRHDDQHCCPAGHFWLLGASLEVSDPPCSLVRGV